MSAPDGSTLRPSTWRFHDAASRWGSQKRRRRHPSQAPRRVAGDAAVSPAEPDSTAGRRSVCRDEARVEWRSRPHPELPAFLEGARGASRHSLPIDLRATFAPDDGGPALFSRQVTLPRRRRALTSTTARRPGGRGEPGRLNRMRSKLASRDLGVASSRRGSTASSRSGSFGSGDESATRFCVGCERGGCIASIGASTPSGTAASRGRAGGWPRFSPAGMEPSLVI